MTRTISAKLPEDLVEEIEEFQEDDESRSAAVRRLVRSGLEAERTNDGLDSITTGMIVAGLVGVILGLNGQIEALSIAFSVAITAVGLVTNYVTNIR
jgi:hypothetical protein